MILFPEDKLSEGSATAILSSGRNGNERKPSLLWHHLGEWTRRTMAWYSVRPTTDSAPSPFFLLVSEQRCAEATCLYYPTPYSVGSTVGIHPGGLQYHAVLLI